MSEQIQKPRKHKPTKKELAMLLEDSEKRNKAFKQTLEACETQLQQWKPTTQTFKITVSQTWFNHRTYEQTRVLLKSLIDAGCVWFTVEQEK